MKRIGMYKIGSLVCYLGGKVFEEGGELDEGVGADMVHVATLLEIARDAADEKLESNLHGASHHLLPLAALPPGHFPFISSEFESLEMWVAALMDVNAMAPLL